MSLWDWIWRGLPTTADGPLPWQWASCRFYLFPFETHQNKAVRLTPTGQDSPMPDWPALIFWSKKNLLEMHDWSASTTLNPICSVTFCWLISRGTDLFICFSQSRGKPSCLILFQRSFIRASIVTNLLSWEQDVVIQSNSTNKKKQKNNNI